MKNISTILASGFNFTQPNPTQPSRLNWLFAALSLLLINIVSAQSPLWYFKDWSSTGAAFQANFQQHIASAKAYDLTGKLLKSGALNHNQSFSIDLSGYPAGMYLLLVSSLNQTYSGKLVKF